MSKFNVGDNIVRITDAVYGQRAGFRAIVDANYCYESLNSVRCRIVDENWELAKPKWSIYNNTIPWSQLSDKQKGKLLLANINDVAICMVAKSLRGDETFINNVEIDKSDVCVYRAQPKPAKPEPTMAELFVLDWMSQESLYKKDIAERMIAKGWTKPCK